MINVFKRRIFNELVFEGPLPFIVLKGKNLFPIKPHASIVLAKKHFSVTRTRNNATGRRLNIYNKNHVLFAGGVDNGNALFANDGTRRARRKSRTLEIFDVASATTIKTRYLAIILDPNN